MIVIAPRLSPYARKRVIELCMELGPPEYVFYVNIAKNLSQENTIVSSRGVRKIFERFQLSSCLQTSTTNVGAKTKVKEDVRAYINSLSRFNSSPFYVSFSR